MASVITRKQRPHYPRLTPEQILAAQAMIHAHPDTSDNQLAKLTGVSRATIGKLRERPAENGDQGETALQEYERRIRKSLPVRDRVAVLTEIVREAKSNPFVRLRAIEVTNELQGLVTRKQQREADQSQVMPQPIFVLPAGAALVSVQQPLQVVVQGVSGDVPGKDKATSD